MTYGEIIEKFNNEIKLGDGNYQDCRPCCEMYEVPNIDNAIVVWLNSGNKIIYIAKEESENSND